MSQIPAGTLTLLFSECFPHAVYVLTGRVFFVAHLKLDASEKFPGDQSIGHNHHQAGDCKQHQQQQNVPKRGRREGKDPNVHELSNSSSFYISLINTSPWVTQPSIVFILSERHEAKLFVVPQAQKTFTRVLTPSVAWKRRFVNQLS